MSAQQQLERLIQRYPALHLCEEDILRAYQILRSCYQQDGLLLVCGNGGSGADSEHIAGELMKEFARRRPLPPDMKERLTEKYDKEGAYLAAHIQGALPVIPLTGNIALSTAYANDAVPDLVFAQQVFGYGKKQNVLLGISTSGNSRNVIYAMEMAGALGMKSIALTGKTGGRLKDIANVTICAPAQSTPDIQELHLPIYHCICRMLEDEFFGVEEHV
ncbi:MAG: SIS domain-containing protein [Lachnospiraceae bacterium]|nr:SIS domain-containing protein [Lachnospiraceae bacterium]